MIPLQPNECKKCWCLKITHLFKWFVCKSYFTDSSPSWWIIETRADGTQHPIKSKENPKTILWQTKKRGIKK